MGQKWYLWTAYDLPISRLVFFVKFKEPWPFKFKETFLSGLINFLRGGVFVKFGVRCKL
jgi:hypothetical protein